MFVFAEGDVLISSDCDDANQKDATLISAVFRGKWLDTASICEDYFPVEILLGEISYVVEHVELTGRQTEFLVATDE